MIVLCFFVATDTSGHTHTHNVTKVAFMETAFGFALHVWLDWLAVLKMI